MRKLIRFRWPLDERGRGKRKDSCYIEPIEVASTLSAKHCGDQTADCSNGVLIYDVPCKVVKPYGTKGGLSVVSIVPNTENLASTIAARDSKGISRHLGDAVMEIISELPLAYDEQNRMLRKDGTVGTLTTDGSSPKHNNRVIVDAEHVRIRRLTPRECWRLQGFPDEYFDKAAAVISDTQLYKAAGNAVTVNVARAIGLKLKEIENEEAEKTGSFEH